jgi:hypothetical protein
VAAVDHVDLAYWRMHNVRLSGPAFDTPADVVGYLGAVQSQDYAPAIWSVGSRLAGARLADTVGLVDAVDAAFGEGNFLRTHMLRPTWHFVRPADLGWMQLATGARVNALSAYYYRQNGVDDAMRKRAAELMGDALAGGHYLTRPELASVLAAGGVDASGPRLGNLMMAAELDAVVCSGPMRGKLHTYALVSERVPAVASPAMDRDEAVAALVTRYFTSHGPATVRDLHWWSSLTMTEIRRALADLGDTLRREVFDGVEYWFAGEPPNSRPPSPTAHLLQGYDEYLVAYQETKYLVDLSGEARTGVSRNISFVGALVIDSQVRGSWHRAVGPDEVVVKVRTYRELNRDEVRGVHTAADAYGHFIGRTAKVVFVP